MAGVIHSPRHPTDQTTTTFVSFQDNLLTALGGRHVSSAPLIPPHPGAPPRRPLVPMSQLARAEAAIDALIDAAVSVRRVHEDAAAQYATIEQFEGAAATSFRTQLVGQLRLLTGLVRELEADRDTIAAARRAGLELEEHHRRAMATYRRELRAHHDAVRRRDEAMASLVPGVAGLTGP